MAECCEDKACTVDALRERQSSMLKTVLGINAVMFAVELAAGLLAGSSALLMCSQWTAHPS
jgi:Co/Zn/Cd efflux system component